MREHSGYGRFGDESLGEKSEPYGAREAAIQQIIAQNDHIW